jgi:glycosyltransferase involved in cell wall biosynthesis
MSPSGSRKMYEVAVCVCTYNRPEGLRMLLEALDLQRFTQLRDEEVRIVVVDNSQDGSAAGICNAYAAHGRFSLFLVHERRKGLSMARNAALVAACETPTRYAASIDDDELPSPWWLQSLLDTMDTTGAAAAVGPVYPIFEVPPGRWVPTSAYADLRPPRDGFVDDGYTCNAMLDLAAVRHLRFDDRFNQMGGEDTIFFKQLREGGARIAWSEQAIVQAIIPRQRMSSAWLWRRWYRTGMIEAYVGRYDPASGKGAVFNFARGLARMLAGSALIAGTALLYGWHKPDKVVASFYTACRGAGLIANVLGRDYKEYSLPTYR